MGLNQNNHRQIGYILLAINVVGLTLVTIAVVFTYYNNSTNTSELQKHCPRYSSVHFEESRDTYGPFMHIDGVVSLIDMSNTTTLCLGTLVQNSTVLISYKCLQRFEMKVSEVDVYLYDESSSLFSRQNSFRTIISYQVSKYDLLVLLFLDEPFDVVETGLISLPKENSGKQCKENGNATLVKFGGRLFPYEVKVLSGSDCFKHYSHYSQNQRSSLFCTGNSGNCWHKSWY